MERHLLRRAGSLLAAVALVVAPLRASVACDMAPAQHDAHQTVEPVAVVDHSMHAGHEMVAPDLAAASEEELPLPPMPCDDWASCAVIALPQVASVRAVRPVPPAAPRTVIAEAPMAPSMAVEPPPPRR
jgi:hypothetical protein